MKSLLNRSHTVIEVYQWSATYFSRVWFTEINFFTINIVSVHLKRGTPENQAVNVHSDSDILIIGRIQIILI